MRAGDVVGIVGAGGKTALLLGLALEARAAGLSVLATATTHMGGLPQAALALVLESDPDSRQRLDQALEKDRLALLLGERLREDKLKGIAPERVDELRGRVDLVVVEADGARRRPLKTPRWDEPVLPSRTSLMVVLAGLDSLGQPFTAEVVHRHELAAAQAEAAPGQVIDEALAARILGHPQGYAARRPARARLALFLNKSDVSRRPPTENVWRRLAPPYERVVVGSARLGQARRIV